MIKYIYKITNKINNKIYIGQSNSPERRWQEHIQQNRNTAIHNAILKYGSDNFSFEIIDSGENYSDLEKYYITKYKSNLQDFGYNLTDGGEDPPLHKGEEHHYAKLTDEQVDSIKQKLINDNKSDIVQIAVYYSVNRSTIERINKGQLWFDEKLSYPLQKHLKGRLHSDIAKNIIDDLKFTSLTQKEIAKKYNVGRSTITMINTGSNHRLENFEYPIRK